jgi:hypothetical protein
MVIAGVLLLGLVVYQSRNPKVAALQEEPVVGTVLPALPGYNWSQHSETVVLVIRKGCPYCENSLPFYRELLNAEKIGKTRANLISVLPDDKTTATQMLHDAQLDVPVAAPFPLQQLHVSATPTVILVDRNGRVQKTWVGEQQADGKKAILDAMRN